MLCTCKYMEIKCNEITNINFEIKKEKVLFTLKKSDDDVC